MTRAPSGAFARIAAKAVAHLIVVVAVPTVCFLLGRSWWGLGGGVALAVGWNLATQTVRRLRGHPLSAVLVLSLGELVVRSSLAVYLHSATMYFLAPACVTACTGAAYVGSAFTACPLLSRLLAEFLPGTLAAGDDPVLAGLLRKATIFYGVEQILCAGLSLVMLTHLSTTAYAAVHPIGSWIVLGLSATVAVPWFRGDLAAAIRWFHLALRPGAMTEVGVAAGHPPLSGGFQRAGNIL